METKGNKNEAAEEKKKKLKITSEIETGKMKLFAMGDAN